MESIFIYDNLPANKGKEIWISGNIFLLRKLILLRKCAILKNYDVIYISYMTNYHNVYK